MKKLSLLILGLAFFIDLAGCQFANYAPPEVTPAMAEGKKIKGDAPKSPGQLQHGRQLFVSRCIECHTLPPVWFYQDKDWPRLVDSMAHRAHLDSADRDAILAYVLAARSQ